LVPEDAVLEPEEELVDEDDVEELLDEELSVLDSFFAADPLPESPDDDPARLSVR
jgi:hypothetical protein